MADFGKIADNIADLNRLIISTAETAKNLMSLGYTARADKTEDALNLLQEARSGLEKDLLESE